MDRKKFILLTGLGVSAVAIPTWYFSSRYFEYDKSISEPVFLSHIWDNSTINEIGKEYRNQFSQEKYERDLVDILSNNMEVNSVTTPIMLQEQITEDYQKGNTVMIDGWILSKTEARQCALFSLIQND